MRNHLVSVYLKAGAITHVQSTNGEPWPADVVEFDPAGVVVPLVRIDVELEPTAAEIANGEADHPAPRPASVLFGKELEVVAGKVRYRAGEGAGGTISDRVLVVLPV